MVLKCFLFFTVWMHLLLLPCISVAAESKCNNKLISSINVTTELGSDVLLPCNFEQTLLRSDKTADIAAVWSQRNIMTDNLLEIKLQGVVLFWSNRGGRIKPFSKLSESGNFSILLHNVSQTDLGLYRCQLFEGINCSLAYQEVHLRAAESAEESLFADGFPAWLITAGGALGGGIVLFSLLLTTYFCTKRSSSTGGCSSTSDHTVSNNFHPLDTTYAVVCIANTSDQTVNDDSHLSEITYAAVRIANTSDSSISSNFHLSDTTYSAVRIAKTSDQTPAKYTVNPMYDTFHQTEPNSFVKEEGISPDTPVYATIKKGK